MDSALVQKESNLEVGKWLAILHNEFHWLVPNDCITYWPDDVSSCLRVEPSYASIR